MPTGSAISGWLDLLRRGREPEGMLQWDEEKTEKVGKRDQAVGVGQNHPRLYTSHTIVSCAPRLQLSLLVAWWVFINLWRAIHDSEGIRLWQHDFSSSCIDAWFSTIMFHDTNLQKTKTRRKLSTSLQIVINPRRFSLCKWVLIWVDWAELPPVVSTGTRPGSGRVPHRQCMQATKWVQTFYWSI